MVNRIENTTEPLFKPPERGFFGEVIDLVKETIFPGAIAQELKEREDFEVAQLKSTTQWRQKQIQPLPTLTSDVAQELPSQDEMELFFRDFFSNLATKYIEVTVIEQIKNGISHGLTQTIQNQAATVISLIITPEADIDLALPGVEELIDRALVYLFQRFENKKELIGKALKDCKISLYYQEALTQNCTIKNMVAELGGNDVKPFLKAIGKQLLPKLLQSDNFLKNFSEAVYETIRPFLESTLANPKHPFADVSAVSPLIKVFADLASLFISKRLTLLCRSVSLKNLFDEAIEKTFKHVQAHSAAMNETDAVKRPEPARYYRSSFASKEGCHRVAKAMMTPTFKDPHLQVKSFLEEVSKTIVDFIINPATVEAFVKNIKIHQRQLEEGNEENPLVMMVIQNICDPRNAPLLSNVILNLKPQTVSAVAKGLTYLGFKRIFPPPMIYQFLFETVAPPVFDLIRDGMILKIVSTELKKTIPAFVEMYPIYLQNPQNVPFDQIALIVRNYYKSTFKKETPPDIKTRIPFAILKLLELLKKQKYIPGVGDDYEKRLRDYFSSEFKSDKVQVYGQLLNHIVFGVSKGGILTIFSWLKDNIYLIRYFRDLFLDGLSHLRGVDNHGNKIEGEDPNQTFFDLTKDSFLKYQDPKEVLSLLQNKITPWDEATIKSRSKDRAKILADLLADLIQLSVPLASRPVAAGAVKAVDLQGHLEYALKVLFQHENVNYNLFFILLEIFNTEIKRLNGLGPPCLDK